MDSNKLAILGGEPLIKKTLPKYNTISKEELEAATRVIKSGKLSGFLGSNAKEFFGGFEVKSFEKQFKEKFGFGHAVCVNSATSGLQIALGALGVGAGDEVIVSPYSMCCSATAPLLYNAIPVFCDIEEDTLCLDPKQLEKLISKDTKAIVVVHLMGHLANMIEIIKIAKKHNIKIIEDAAQAVGAKHNSKYAGSFGDISVFSFNCHKIVQTGEGGMCCTENEELFKRMCLLRNHAEAVIAGGFEVDSLNNMLGFNLRMGEIEAAIGKEQIKKLDALVEQRNELASALSFYLKDIESIILPKNREGFYSTWYTYCLRLKDVGVKRNIIAKALAAEGIPITAGYVEPLYLMPIFQKKELFKNGYPFSLPENKGLNQNYQQGVCPVCERIEKDELLQIWGLYPPLTKAEVRNFAFAFEKVFSNLEQLKGLNDDLSLPNDSGSRRQVFKSNE